MFFPVNRYNLFGFILLILGFFTIPILIGFIIMPIGILFFCYGMLVSICSMLPGHQKLEPQIKTFKEQYIESSPILTMIFSKRQGKNPDKKE